ncbi:hypothetical protein LLH06_06605 [Mucilaginibacter daejeonensis]|uniref:hypothetical protein n=1 Tax=Mucilaginibacter daejeonensis TaxID=398049 RepID=UPI001D17AD43|nr:hypothetical protein [Mucilaginibacter daejeonensis]UEG54630.1 hypothetical protein LLH06_06605 [Mucilaginibacter daejeonensis]
MHDLKEATGANGEPSSKLEDNPYAQSNLWKVVITFVILLLILMVGAVKYLMR